MKIAIASTGLGHIYRGVEAWADDTAATLYQKGIDVTLFKGGGKPEHPYEVVVSCYQRDLPKTHRLIKFFSYLSGWRYYMGLPYHVEQFTFALNVIRHLRKGFDIVHTQDPQLAILLQRFKRFGLIKAEVILAHGTEEDNTLLAKIKYLQQIAPFHLDQVREAGIAKDTWFCAPNFIDTRMFKPRSKNKMRELFDLPQDAFIILQAAAIKRHHKRIDFAIDCIAKLKATIDVPLLFVVVGGREDDTDDVIEYGKKMLGDSVRFYVNLPRENMPGLYAASDLFMLTSLMEMLGIVFLEAMACGVPAVGSNHPVQQWVIGSGGDSIDMTDQDAVVNILKRYMTDQTYMADKQKNALAWVKEHFAKDVVIAQYIEKYTGILSGKHNV